MNRTANRKNRNIHGEKTLFDVVSRKKSRAALALAVSLWMATGGVASATGWLYLKVDNNDELYQNGTRPEDATVSNSGKTLTITGGTSWGNWNLKGGQSSSSAVEGYTLNLSDVKGTFTAEGGNANSNTVSGNTVEGTNIETNDAIRGGISSGNQASSNTVLLKNSTVGIVYGSRGSTGANNSSVTLENTTVNDSVYGGNTFSGTATGNTVALKNSIITNSIYGGFDRESATDVVTGNTLNLSGANTAGAVQNFATININSATWGTSALTLTGDGILQNQDNTYAAINTQDLSFSGDVPVTGTTTLISSTNALPNTLKVFTGATAKATITTAGVVVKQDATPTESKANGVTLAYKNTHTVALAADSKSITYNIATNPVSTVALGSIDWVKDGTARTLTAGDFTFDGNTAIDKTGFTFTNPLSVGAGESMTLLANATGLTAGDSIAHTQTITKDETNGAKLTATLSGNITRTANTLGYTATGTTLNSVNLANWNGTASAVPTGWTAKTDGVSVTGDRFTAPSITTGNSVNILTTGTDGFFSNANISDTIKYQNYGEVSDTDKGVTLTGNESKGVKANTDGKNLIYERDFAVDNITLGSIEWNAGGTVRDGATYDFATNAVSWREDNVKDFTFTFANEAAYKSFAPNATMTLISNAAGVHGGYTRASSTFDYTVANGAKLDTWVRGLVDINSNTLTYKNEKVAIESVNLAGWDSTKAAFEVPNGWIGEGVPVTAEGFTEPTITAGTSKGIITTNTEGFFDDDQIEGALKYKAGVASSDTANGVTLTGSESKGVKASDDGKNLLYSRSNFEVNNITLGSIAWNAGGTVRDGAAYDFATNTVYWDWEKVKNLAFTFANEAAYKSLAKDATMTLISNAWGINGSSCSANTTFDYTVANGATLNTKVWGQLNAGDNGYSDTLTYKITGVDIKSVDLAGWNSTKDAFVIPNGWNPRGNASTQFTNSPVSVTAEGFTAPTIGAGSSREIITTNTAGFFDDNQITGALKYKTGVESSDAANGVTLTGSESKGVKASDDGKNLVYARSNFEVSGISLGNMTWGTAREATMSYDFNHVADANISAANLKFSNPESIAKDATTTLLSGATNLNAGTDIAHTQDFTKTVNGATLSATLSGNVTRTAETLGYKATGTALTGVDLTGWNGTTGNVPEGWTAKSGGVSVTADSTFAPSITAGTPKNILTAATDNYFSNAQIADAIQYKPDAESSDTANGVTLTGAESKGVKVSDDGKSLVYARSKFNVSGISLGNMTWGTARAASTSYDFQNVTDANISAANLEFSNPETIAKDATTTLLSGATHLAAGDNIAHTQNFTKTVNGTTLSATLSGNVIRTTAGTLGYKATDTALNKATLGGFAWGAEADSIPEGWTVSAATTIDATNFKYEGTADTAIAARDIATILNAPGLTTDSPVTGGRNKTVPIDYTNGESHINFKATATGDVEAAENMVQYVVKSVALSNVNLGDWNGTASGVPQNWTGSQVAVSTGNFNIPTKLAAGQSIDILTTSTANFFGTVSGDRKYRSETFENSEAGVTLSGHNFGGVKVENYGEAANAKLTYYAETMDTTAITLGEMTWGVSRDGNGAGYNYASAAIDASGLKFANWKPEETAANSSTILLLANDTLTDFTAVNKSYSYSVVPTSGVTLDGAVRGSVSKSGNNIVYTATENKASKLTFGTVSWMKEGALIDHAATLTNVSFEGAAVDTTNIKFQNLQTAASEDKMTLVSSFGSSIGTVTGTEFSVGKGKGEGHAYLESNDLKYVVTQGVNFDPKGDDNAINEAGAPVGGEIASDVIGGVAQNTGVAKDNTMEVLAGSDVSGSVTAAISVNGASEKNEAQVTDANVSGSVTGAEVNGSGTAAGNKATVENTIVGDGQNHTGDVIGAKTDSGLATGNIANVTGGQVEGSVIGAKSTSGTVSGVENKNAAIVNNANVGGSVYGGLSTTGEVNANKAELSNGAVVVGDVYGGKTDGEKKADGNQVAISGATVEGTVYGGYSDKGTADGNKVEIGGEDTVVGDVYGGKSKTASDNNEITFKGGTARNIVGGGCDTAAGNIVNFEGGEVDNIYGALTGTSATNNTINLSGGKVNQTVYGGYSDSGETRNNSVYLYGTADVHTANIFGGNREATGNTLTIGLSSGNTNTPWTGGEQTVKQTVKNISNFENISFAVVPWSESKAAVTITDGTASNLSMAKIDAKKVHFTNVDSLKKDDAMTLLDQSRASKKATTVEEKSEFTIGSGVQGKGYLSLDKENGNVVYTVGEMGASEQSHNTVMGATVGMATLSAGNDFIGSATEGLSLASNVGADGVSSFAQMGGGSMRQETGSHVDTHTWNAILALGHQNKKERGTMEYGAFFEYGTGNYSTFNGDERGDGSTKYTGGGLLAKWTAKHGFYVEGSLRAGTVHDDARNVLRDEVTRVPYSYETDAPYIGFHLGVGKEIAFDDIHSLDVYGKYFYNRRNGVSFDAGGHYDLDAVTSQVVRVGARYTIKQDKWNFYGGVAYEHELDGKASGTVDGFAIRGADTSGGSFRGEIGATMKPAENSPWSLDLNVSGFAGKKQGFTGGVSVAFMF